MNTVLFLCSGNYYRSRFAELLFNAHAEKAGNLWRAESRGFFLHPNNAGPISQHARRGLELRGVPVGDDVRFPQVVTEQDLEAARHIVAVKEAEHRPQLEANFPGWTRQVEFWRIDDLDCAAPEVALAQLEQAVLDLMRRLANYGLPDRD
jgi:protein-tyrosine phosphatase